MPAVLSVRDLSTGYGKKQVLFDVSLTVRRGELLCVTGGNGSGKSTLLKAIFGLLPSWNKEAHVVFRPTADAALSPNRANRNLANGLAYVPQKEAVFEELSVDENLALAGNILRKGQLRIRRADVLDRFPIIAATLSRKPATLSGGERRMVALSMALLHQPKLLLLDEPIAGLDAENARQIADAIHAINKEGTAVVLVEHRLAAIIWSSCRTINMEYGGIVDAPSMQWQTSPDQ